VILSKKHFEETNMERPSDSDQEISAISRNIWHDFSDLISPPRGFFCLTFSSKIDHSVCSEFMITRNVSMKTRLTDFAGQTHDFSFLIGMASQDRTDLTVSE
jgi:hypothetical protein